MSHATTLHRRTPAPLEIEPQARVLPNPVARKTERERMSAAHKCLRLASRELLDAQVLDIAGRDPNENRGMEESRRFLSLAEDELRTLEKVAPRNLAEVKRLRARFDEHLTTFVELGGELRP
jgi:hypothetical protein